MLNVGRRELRIPMYSKAQLRKAYKTLVDKNLIKSSSYLKFLKNKLAWIFRCKCCYYFYKWKSNGQFR